MQKLQDTSFSILKTTDLSPAVFSFLQPTNDADDKTPLGGILNDSKHGWLALGPKFCVIDLKTGLKIAAWTFGANTSSTNNMVTSVIELPTPLTENSIQLVISLECDETTGLIAVFHVNGSQILRCIQMEVVVTELTVCDVPDGPFTCFDGLVVAGTKSGEILVFDLHRAALLQALNDITRGNEQVICNEQNLANLTFLPLKAVSQISEQRELALENDEHIALLLNENSFVDGQYLFHNPDGTVRMKAKRDHIRVSTMMYIPQLGSVTVGYNFGAFQIWNLMTLQLEFTSQVNVECLPVTHFGFQEPCDDPRAFCYLWVVYSSLDLKEEQFPLAAMYSLTYQGKRMLSDDKVLYEDFIISTIRFQVELSAVPGAEAGEGAFAGRCISCSTFSLHSTLGEDTTLNICQLVWEYSIGSSEASEAQQFGMLLFDLDQWYKDQMPATYNLQSNTFMSVSGWNRRGGRLLAARLAPSTVAPYSHATRLEEHFYPNSLQYNCICLNTYEVVTLHTPGVQRQIISSILWLGERAFLAPSPLYFACLAAGLTPLYADSRGTTVEQQRRFLLSVALEARLVALLSRLAHDWATGAHAGVGCTLPFMVDWCWQRAIELKQNAKELTAPLFSSSALPDKNVVRCLEHCVRQLTELTSLLDNVLTKCCNLVVPDALSEMEEKHRGISTVALYFRAVQWLLGAGLLPERRAPATPAAPADVNAALPYPGKALAAQYNKRRVKLHRLQDGVSNETSGDKSCSLLYIDQLIEYECGGEKVHEMWRKGGDGHNGLYPPPTLYALLRLYLRPEIADEHKHSLVLYLLLDYSVLYDDGRYETVIRRLMQFPTMFGLSNTAIKATQAFWHLDHRDFDFALDQLQCLTGNTLAEWQHNVVLSSLLAQKKTQQALQYLHVRKPPPKASNYENFNDFDKLECWQSSCDLYLARGLVFEALDVIRMCVANAATNDDKLTVMNFFFKGCRNTGQLSKILDVSLQPFEEEVFIRFLESCNDQQTSDILVMFYLQQARYLEAQQYNSSLKQVKPKPKDISASVESLLDWGDKTARDTIVDVVCGTLPGITGKVAHTAMYEFDAQPHVLAPKPMSVFVQAKSPKNKFTYKSSFIQDTIENASETWVNKPQMRKGLKRALNIEEIPFLCTPKLNRNRSNFSKQDQSEGTPPKRLKLELSPKAPKNPQSTVKISEQLTKEIETLLEMPEVQSPPHWRLQDYERDDRGTPHSILKIRRSAQGAPSPVDSRYLGDSEDEIVDIETASHYSDKHLRFEIPSTVSEYGSTPSPTNFKELEKEKELFSLTKERDADINKSHVLESPTKLEGRKSYKDTVRARRSNSISANSSLCDDHNTSIESIADLPYNLVNTSYRSVDDIETENTVESDIETTVRKEEGRITPKGRRPIGKRGKSATPERVDSPVSTPMSIRRLNRSKSRTPERSLDSITELPGQESESASRLEVPLPHSLVLTAPRLRSRSRSRTPERLIAKVSPRLEAITESPTKMEVDPAPPSPRRSLRSRSRTPEVEEPKEIPATPRNLRSRSKTPDREKVLTPQEKTPKTRKSLSRIVLEHNTFKAKPTEEVDQSESIGESTPMKSANQTPGNLLNITFSPINQSILKSPMESFSESLEKEENSDKTENKSIAFTTLSETFYDKSILKSYQSSVGENSTQSDQEIAHSVSKVIKMDQSNQLDSSNSKSVLKDVSSLMTSDNESMKQDTSVQKEKKKIVEIENEIREIEVDISDDGAREESSDSDDSSDDDGNGEEEQEDNDIISIGDSTDESSSSEQELQIDEDVDSRQSFTSASRDTVEIDPEQVDIYEGFETIESNIQGKIVKDDEESTKVKNKEDNNTVKESETIEDTDNKTTNQIESNIKDQKSLVEDTKRSEVTKESLNEKVEIQPSVEENKAEDPFAPSVSLLTDDNSTLSDQSDVNLNYSDETKTDENNVVDKMEQDDAEVAEQRTELQIDLIVDKIPEEVVNIETIEPQMSADIDVVDAVTHTKDEVMEPAKVKRTRKRVKSTSSNKSNKSNISTNEEIAPEKAKTPVRKRTKSTSSNQSEEAENLQTPITVRRILTRRASKELAEKSIENSMELDESVILTPKRRARSKRKTEDSDSSMKPKEEVQVRKGRKSILATKPDLSVIPENTTEESASRIESNSEIMAEYSNSRRLTRTQRSVLESWLEPGRSPSLRRRGSRQSSISESPEIEDDASSTASMEPLVKGSDGSPERDGLRDPSPVSLSPEVSKPKRSLTRAASENKTVSTATPKRKPTRRLSIDVVNLTPSDLDVTSRPRSRRACFNKAVEALNTPKRRASTDVKRSDSVSSVGSPAPSEAPARRARRVASPQSNASANSESLVSTPRRTKKTSASEEKKGAKK